jgi:hypothetical protein
MGEEHLEEEQDVQIQEGLSHWGSVSSFELPNEASGVKETMERCQPGEGSRVKVVEALIAGLSA